MDTVTKKLENLRNKINLSPVAVFFYSPIGIGHIINSLYGGAFTIQIAMLPFLVMELGQPIEFNGYVITVFSVLQFVGSILFGRLADYIGPSFALLLSQASSTLTYSLMAVAVNRWMLLLSQLPGLFMQGFQAAALLICYETSLQQRTPSIAYLNLSYGIGAVCGGLLAAIVSTFVGPRGTLLIGGIITVLGSFLAIERNYFIPVVLPFLYLLLIAVEDFNELRSNEKLPDIGYLVQKTGEEYSRLADILTSTMSICILLIVGLFPVLMTRFSFAPLAVDVFGLTPTGTSYLVAYIGCLTVLAEGILAPYLASKFGDITCCKLSTILTALGFVFLTIAGIRRTFVLVALVLPLCGGALLYVCATSQMTKRVQKNEIGSVLGINGAIFYLIAGVSPILALTMYGAGGIDLYWGVCAVFSVALVIYLFYFDERTLNAYSWDPPPYTA